jgi:hypothetical protein
MLTVNYPQCFAVFFAVMQIVVMPNVIIPNVEAPVNHPQR